MEIMLGCSFDENKKFYAVVDENNCIFYLTFENDKINYEMTLPSEFYVAVGNISAKMNRTPWPTMKDYKKQYVKLVKKAISILNRDNKLFSNFQYIPSKFIDEEDIEKQFNEKKKVPTYKQLEQFCLMKELQHQDAIEEDKTFKFVIHFRSYVGNYRDDTKKKLEKWKQHVIELEKEQQVKMYSIVYIEDERYYSYSTKDFIKLLDKFEKKGSCSYISLSSKEMTYLINKMYDAPSVLPETFTSTPGQWFLQSV